MAYCVTVLPENIHITAQPGENLLSCLRRGGVFTDAPCGGQGRCGKCRVILNGAEVLACQTAMDRDMTLTLPSSAAQILTAGSDPAPYGPVRPGWALAFDIGTTTVVGFLLRDGQEMACESRSNPQIAFGADVITRIGCAQKGNAKALTAAIRDCLEEMTHALCRKATIHPHQIATISFVGNPAMQQLFLGMDVENLAKLPFAPVLTKAKILPAKEYLPCWENAGLLIVPDISGFVGADTVGCVLSSRMYHQEEMTLLVDIGTNGEMVLGNQDRLLACSTAAGPALEGANIRCGMRGKAGAIDHVWPEPEGFGFSVIGGGAPQGICGSGLIDAAAGALEKGLLNRRGKVLTPDRCIHIAPNISLTQEDIRQLQLAKGAIRAGIELLARQMGIDIAQIDRVYWAGAFGSFMDAASACRIGLLPPQLAGKITALGNAAGSGAKRLATEENALAQAQKIAEKVEFIELATLPDFPRTFAKQMEFETK